MSGTPRQRAYSASSAAVQGSAIVVSRAFTLYPLRLLVPTVAFIVTVLIVAPLGQAGDMRFYQAAATIIVVLVLSLATQGHFFVLRALPDPPEWIARRGTRVRWLWRVSEQFAAVGVLGYLGVGEGAEQFAAVGVLGYLGVGEGAALYAIASSSPHGVLLAVSSGAIAAGFFAIGTIALLGEMGTPVRAAGEPGQD